MGNALGGRNAKVMKVDGETFKVRTPVRAGEVAKDHPGLVLMDSAEVKRLGVRARPMEAGRSLKPKGVYFLVDLPEAGRAVKRVGSGIKMGAKERLESLLLARRSVSDLSEVRTSHALAEEYKRGVEGNAMRVRMTLPRAAVERIVRESASEAEAAEKIMELCNRANAAGGASTSGGVAAEPAPAREHKRVSFLPMNEGRTRVAVAS